MLVHKNLIPLYTKNQKQLYFKCNLCHFVKSKQCEKLYACNKKC